MDAAKTYHLLPGIIQEMAHWSSVLSSDMAGAESARPSIYFMPKTLKLLSIVFLSRVFVRRSAGFSPPPDLFEGDIPTLDPFLDPEEVYRYMARLAKTAAGHDSLGR